MGSGWKLTEELLFLLFSFRRKGFLFVGFFSDDVFGFFKRKEREVGNEFFILRKKVS